MLYVLIVKNKDEETCTTYAEDEYEQAVADNNILSEFFDTELLPIDLALPESLKRQSGL